MHRLACGIVLSFVTLVGCADPPAPAAACDALTATLVDRCVRINQIQVLGTHNSYHLAPEPALLARLGNRGRDFEYSHRPIVEQLASLGVRQLEIDVFADPEGGRYAQPAARRLVPALEPVSAAMHESGFKVQHVQDIDYRTTCATLEACLTQLRDWSQASPAHVPVLVLIEVKDGMPRDPDGLGFVEPVPFDTPMLLALDAAIRDVFSDDHLLTPDDVRGGRATLHEAITTDGWPLLGEARGKVLFALDNTGEHRLRYLEGAPSLEGRVMFVSSPPGEPSSAFLKLNEALDENGSHIRQMVEAGYLVRTRADVPTAEARAGLTVRRDAAFASGAQYVSTDHPDESPFGAGYIARLPGAETLPARCNPVTAPAGCEAAWLEPAAGRP